MKKFNRINVEIGVDRKPHYQIEYIENGEIYVGYCSCDFEKVLKWKEENLDVKEIVVNENGETTYERGLADAWEAARKIVMYETDGGLREEVTEKIFGTKMIILAVIYGLLWRIWRGGYFWRGRRISRECIR